MDFFGEDHYRDKARKMGVPSLERGNYLKSMSPREELSSFLTTRADCLRENGRFVDAYRTYKKAVELAPENLFAAGLLRMTAKVVQHRQQAGQIEAAFQRHERRRRTDPRLRIPGLPSVPTVHVGKGPRPRQGQPVPAPQALPPPAGFGARRAMPPTHPNAVERRPWP